MPVLVLRVVLVLEPLLELAVAADLVRGDPGYEVLELRGELGVPPQDLGRLHRVGEEVADDLVVHRRAHDEAALLGRVGRPADQPAGLRVLDEEVHEEQRGVLHDRVGPIREELHGRR